MLLLDLSNCGPSGLLRVIYFFKILLDIVFVIIPVALIILLIIDFTKMAASSNDGDQKKMFNLALKRILSAVLVFFVPFFVEVFNLVLGELGVNYSVCLNNLTIKEINRLQSVEFANEKAEEMVRRAENYNNEDAFAEAQKYINELSSTEIKKQLQERLDTAKEYSKADVNVNYDGYSTSGKCSSVGGIVLKKEPDPSCAINFWSKYIESENFIYPEINGEKLGAWPNNYDSIPKQLNNLKTYSSGRLIWPVTPENGIYNFVYEHNGIDIMSVIGTPIYAPADGTLIYSEWGHTTNKGSDETAYTLAILMDDPIIQDGVTYDRIFMTHMSGIINRCAEGSCNKKVKKGELVGFVGNGAGEASSIGYAPHLHITIHPNGYYRSGLNTTKTQKLFGLECGSGCKNISIKAGG